MQADLGDCSLNHLFLMGPLKKWSLLIVGESVGHEGDLIASISAQFASCQFEFAADLIEAQGMLKNSTYDLVLVDFNSDRGFVDTLSDYFQEVAFIFLIERLDPALVAQLIESGVQYYLVKDTDGIYRQVLPTIIGKAFQYIIEKNRLRLLESVVLNANDSILITEAEPYELPGPRIVYANEGFTKMSGYSLEEVLGKTPRILQGVGSQRPELDRIRTAL